MTDEEYAAAKKKANEVLEKAIMNRMALYKNYNGEILTEWIVIYAAEDFDEHRAINGSIFPGGRMQTHRALGLIDLAKFQLLQRYDQRRQED